LPLHQHCPLPLPVTLTITELSLAILLAAHWHATTRIVTEPVRRRPR
jgi:hypothetical protein